MQRGFRSLAARLRRPAGSLAAALLLLAAGTCALRASETTFAERLKICGACHGTDGNSARENIPSLAGQPEIFLTNQLIYFREGLRHSELMAPLVEGLTDADIEALARYYSRLPPATINHPMNRQLYDKGGALSKTMRCGTCHLPDYSGRAQMPRLAGQREDYLVPAMRSYLNETRGGPDTTMIDVLRGLTVGDIRALAHYISLQNTRK